MKIYKPKFKVGDIVKYQNKEHDLILQLGKFNKEPVYNILTLDTGKYDDDVYCDDYDKVAVKVA